MMKMGTKSPTGFIFVRALAMVINWQVFGKYCPLGTKAKE